MGQYAKVDNVWISGTNFYRKESGLWVAYANPKQIMTAAHKHIFFDARVVAILVTLRGAPGETITITGATTGSLTLNSDGVEDIYLNIGETSFIGSVGNYSVTETVTSNTLTIDVFPPGIVYWYGRIGDGISLNNNSFSTLSGYSTHTVTQNTNNLYVYLRNRSAGSNYSANNCKTQAYFSSVSKGNYTSLKFYLHDFTGTTSAGYSYIQVGQATASTCNASNPSYSPNKQIQASNASAQTVTLTMSSGTYVGILARRQAAANSSGTTQRTTAVYVDKIWRE